MRDLPESPHFERLAGDLLRAWLASDRDHASVGAVAEQLRLVWNARGAADLAKIEAMQVAQPLSMKGLDRALRSLDR